MTMTTAHQFIELLERDVPLQTQLAVFGAKNAEDVMDFANAKGYIFTEKEFMTALKDHPESRVARELRQLLH
jgi:predicted ribosomally synthesized peptide with nif11-like leader